MQNQSDKFTYKYIYVEYDISYASLVDPLGTYMYIVYEDIWNVVRSGMKQHAISIIEKVHVTWTKRLVCVNLVSERYIHFHIMNPETNNIHAFISVRVNPGACGGHS